MHSLSCNREMPRPNIQQGAGAACEIVSPDSRRRLRPLAKAVPTEFSMAEQQNLLDLPVELMHHILDFTKPLQIIGFTCASHKAHRISDTYLEIQIPQAARTRGIQSETGQYINAFRTWMSILPFQIIEPHEYNPQTLCILIFLDIFSPITDDAGKLYRLVIDACYYATFGNTFSLEIRAGQAQRANFGSGLCRLAETPRLVYNIKIFPRACLPNLFVS